MTAKKFDEFGYFYLTLRVVGVYFLTVLGLIAAIVYYQVPLYKNQTPTCFIYLVWVIYYIVPIFLAGIVGFVFRPFKENFRNVYAGIIFIQLFYSFIVSMLRWDYLGEWQNKNGWKKSDRIRITEWTPRYFDRNQDGFVDEIRIKTVFDFTKIRPSHYALRGVIVPDSFVSSLTVDGDMNFSVSKNSSENMISKEFVITPSKTLDAASYQTHNFQLKILLFRIITIDERGKAILASARWSPFLRATNWQGFDHGIYENRLLLDQQTPPEVFSLYLSR